MHHCRNTFCHHSLRLALTKRTFAWFKSATFAWGRVDLCIYWGIFNNCSAKQISCSSFRVFIEVIIFGRIIIWNRSLQLPVYDGFISNLLIMYEKSEVLVLLAYPNCTCHTNSEVHTVGGSVKAAMLLRCLASIVRLHRRSDPSLEQNSQTSLSGRPSGLMVKPCISCHHYLASPAIWPTLIPCL